MTSESVKVLIRIRPEHPPVTDGVVSVRDSSTVILLPKPYGGSDAMASRRSQEASAKAFKVDRVFGPSASQLDVYSEVQPLVLSVASGYNATVFAYGHTGSGKTHTMSGIPGDPGIIPRTVSDVFQTLQDTAARSPETIFLVRMSYVELYNNTFRNLLDWDLVEFTEQENRRDGDAEESAVFRAARSERIEVRETKIAGVHLSGRGLRAPVTSASSVIKLIAAGNQARAVGATNCNQHSSRSHSIVTLYVESRIGFDSDSEVRVGKLHLVDLAGSERVSLSGAEGDTLVETQSINLSLSTLGDVLSALSRNTMAQGQGKGATRQEQSAPVPYRNSKLTHLLKDSLGGNSKTLMIATLRAGKEHHSQSMMSLMYASRAKNIRNVTKVNRDTVGGSSIHQVSEEIELLRARLVERTEEFDRLRDLHSTDTLENQKLRVRLEEIGRVNESEKAEVEMKVASIIHNQAGQMALQRRAVTALQSRLSEELNSWRQKCEEQKAQISELKDMVSALERVRSGHGATREEVVEMQGLLEAWQVQATSAQRELVVVSERLKEVAQQRSLERRRAAELEQQAADLKVALKEETLASSALRLRHSQELDREREAHATLKQEGARAKATVDQEAGRAQEHIKEIEERCSAAVDRSAVLASELEASQRELEEHRSAALSEASHAQGRINDLLNGAETAASALTSEAASAETLRLERRVLIGEKRASDEKLVALEGEHAELLADLRRFQSSVVAMQADTQAVIEEKNRSAEKGRREASEAASELLALKRVLATERSASSLQAKRTADLEVKGQEVAARLVQVEERAASLAAERDLLQEQFVAARKAASEAGLESTRAHRALEDARRDIVASTSREGRLVAELEEAAAGLAASRCVWLLHARSVRREPPESKMLFKPCKHF